MMVTSSGSEQLSSSITNYRKQVSVFEVGGLDHIPVQLLFGQRFRLFSSHEPMATV